MSIGRVNPDNVNETGRGDNRGCLDVDTRAGSEFPEKGTASCIKISKGIPGLIVPTIPPHLRPRKCDLRHTYCIIPCKSRQAVSCTRKEFQSWVWNRE